MNLYQSIQDKFKVDRKTAQSLAFHILYGGTAQSFSAAMRGKL